MAKDTDGKMINDVSQIESMDTEELFEIFDSNNQSNFNKQAASYELIKRLANAVQKQGEELQKTKDVLKTVINGLDI